jgi:hypothetical protein
MRATRAEISNEDSNTGDSRESVTTKRTKKKLRYKPPKGCADSSLFSLATGRRAEIVFDKFHHLGVWEDWRTGMILRQLT